MNSSVECSPDKSRLEGRTKAMYAEHLQAIHSRADRMFARLMIFQWLVTIVAAVWLTPRTWAGAASSVHSHVWAAILFGGAITVYPVILAWLRPGETMTRHVIAACQLMMSALLIDLTGGRIETHFHVFGSLAFLAFYRDWRVLVTGTIVTAVDHLARGILFPASVYGAALGVTWRWLEHAGWVAFEDVFLIISCKWSLSELHGICERDTLLEASNHELEQKVSERTASLKEANAHLEALATTDLLTGLPNHGALVALMDSEIERAQRFERSFSILFLDIDHFKALNDGRGHAVGDAALSEVGAVAKRCLRGMDTIGRWGGEEFIVLLPETGEEAAMVIAERIRATIAGNHFESIGGLYLTCSIGAATYPANAPSRSELVDAGDRAMYAAKKLGRNQVRSISDPIVSSLEAGPGASREEATLKGTVEALADLADARNSCGGDHVKDVEELATLIAIEMGLDSSVITLVGMVGKLHDIGKVAIPDVILQRVGKLSEAEWQLMRKHPIIGADVVSRVPMLRMAAPGIRGHHERWDGAGYPDNLSGETIPLAARIVAVADSYSAMTSDRPYQSARASSAALQELISCAGSHFDPTVVDAAQRVLVRDRNETLDHAA